MNSLPEIALALVHKMNNNQRSSKSEEIVLLLCCNRDLELDATENNDSTISASTN